MATQLVNRDKYICTEGQPLDAIHIIVSGSVSAYFEGGEIELKKGDIVGLLDTAYSSHSFNYKTTEDSSFVSFACKGASGFEALIKQNPEIGRMAFNSMINQASQIFSAYRKAKNDCQHIFDSIHATYEAYEDICVHNNIIARSLPSFESLSMQEEENMVPEWILAYYNSMKEFPQELKLSLYARSAYLTGMVIRGSEDVHSAFSSIIELSDLLSTNVSVMMQESGLDLFDLYSSLLLRLKADSHDYEIVKKTIDEMIEALEFGGLIDPELLRQRVSNYRNNLVTKKEEAEILENGDAEGDAMLSDATNIILEYAGVDAEIATAFKTALSQYKKIQDKTSYDEPVRKVRMELTNLFYKIYSEAFIISVRDENIPPVLKMFFNFGFVDAELAGMSNARYLLSLADKFAGNPENGVYTALEWFNAIYMMKKEPSRNDLDLDYLEYLHDLKMQGKIDNDTERILAKDPGERVLFELNNMFPLVNKVTYGRISSFCPVLSEHDMIKTLDSCMVLPESILESYKKLEAIDYSAFYRETMYVNEAAGIAKETINVRVLPDVILMPNIGTRGIMWQEIEGKKRSTPSRFVISVFHLDDLPTTITRLTGEYRWEMCKRIQGSRWNDVSDKSLTSEYFDYVQFYKKNNELSTDAKEKIKNSLQKAKNSFKEMFVRDYITWVMFEGTGSPRLNKLARSIFVTYCPFPYDLRQKIAANPLFKSLIERYEIKLSQKLHHFDNVIQKMNASNIEVPQELSDTRNFLEGKVNN